MNSLSKKVGLLVIVILAVGAILAVNLSKQSTENRQHASGIINLNTGNKIADSRNYDGSMGPANWYSNFSNSLAPDSVGSLIFSVTDPVQVGKQPNETPPYGNAFGGKPSPLPTVSPSPTCRPRPSCLDATPRCMIPETSDMCPKSNATPGGQPSVSPQAGLNGPQTVKALILKITKVEVHLAYLGTPGSQKPTARPSSSPGGKPSGAPVDHWETLNITSPMSVDLVQLAKGGVAALGLTKLAAGQYTEIRLYVSNATAKLNDGTVVTLTMVGKDNIVRIVQPFTIIAGQTTSLTMDFDAQHSVIATGNGRYLLKPVVASLLETR